MRRRVVAPIAALVAITVGTFGLAQWHPVAA